MLQVKICGITQREQGRAIAQLGATALGYICVERSPRYITPEKIAAITTGMAAINPDIEHFGVFADAPLAEMLTITQTAGLSVIQLHGDETIATCQLLRDALKVANLPHVKLVKAMRIRDAASLAAAIVYEPYVDTLLLDAYDPQQLGGTGHTLDWRSLQTFTPNRPWFLAGGLRPDNVRSALAQLSPNGIDLSSGVEKSPGDKDLAKVRELFEQLKRLA